MKINLEIEMKSLALRFESFRSQKLEDPSLPHSCFFIRKIVHSWASSCNAPKDESKINPWDAWVLELDEDSLNSLICDGITIHKECFHPSPKTTNYSWEENPRNESYFSWAHQEQDGRFWWCPWSGDGDSFHFLLLLQSPFKSFLSLVLGFILVLGV